MRLILVCVFLAAELLVVAAAALWRLARAPVPRRPLWVMWLVWNALPFWMLWRAACGRVLRLAVGRAVRACEAHEHAKATATYPAQDAGV